jgi:hypothetical protein
LAAKENVKDGRLIIGRWLIQLAPAAALALTPIARAALAYQLADLKKADRFAVRL